MMEWFLFICYDNSDVVNLQIILWVVVYEENKKKVKDYSDFVSLVCLVYIFDIDNNYYRIYDSKELY